MYFDAGGYFIINGSEKTVLGQERAAENQVYCFNVKKSNKWSWMAEIKSVPDYKCISPKQINMILLQKIMDLVMAFIFKYLELNNHYHYLLFSEHWVLLSDEEICETILLDINDIK